VTVDEGPAAMKTGSDGDCSDSDAAVMSTDRLYFSAKTRKIGGPQPLQTSPAF